MPRRTAARTPLRETWEDAPDPVLAHAVEVLGWYERARRRARFASRAGDLLTLLSTAATVVVSALHAPAAATASLAAVTLLLAGYRQVFDPDERWVSTGIAWMQVRQALTRYRLLPEAERDDAARRELAERTMETMSAETESWGARRRGNRPPAEPLPRPPAP